MKTAVTVFTALSAATIALAPISVASAKNSHGYKDLIGARGSSAEAALSSRGYKLKGNVGAASMWWNHATHQCVSMLVENGRVDSIQPANASDCGKGTAPAAASNAGVCPVDVSQADRHKYPACDNPMGNSNANANVCPPDVSQADRYKYPACN